MASTKKKEDKGPRIELEKEGLSLCHAYKLKMTRRRYYSSVIHFILLIKKNTFPVVSG